VILTSRPHTQTDDHTQTDTDRHMGTTGVVLPTKSSWTRASAAAAAAVALLAGMAASLAGPGRSSGDGAAAARMRLYADGSVAKGTTSLPPVPPSAAGPAAVDEGRSLADDSMHRLGVNRRKSTVPPSTAIFVVCCIQKNISNACTAVYYSVF